MQQLPSAFRCLCCLCEYALPLSIATVASRVCALLLNGKQRCTGNLALKLSDDLRQVNMRFRLQSQASGDAVGVFTETIT